MVFVYTCSQDVTFDILQPHLKGLSVFRLNIDKPEDYVWDFSKKGFVIKDVRTGLRIDTQTLTSFYMRKPIYFDLIDLPREGCLENWRREETDEIFQELFRECEARGLTALVRSRHERYGKLRQMHVAENYFKVPDWHIFHGELPADLKKGKWVAKTLTDTPIGKGKAFFVKEVEPTALDLSYPWFLQAAIDGEEEVTVVTVNGRLFGYSYPRKAIEASADVRKATFENPSLWRPCELTPSEATTIRGFMAHTGYRFGRFDFIRKDGELWFLELNPNGQWAWLDRENANGLISCIAEALTAEDTRHCRLQTKTACRV